MCISGEHYRRWLCKQAKTAFSSQMKTTRSYTYCSELFLKSEYVFGFDQTHINWHWTVLDSIEHHWTTLDVISRHWTSSHCIGRHHTASHITRQSQMVPIACKPSKRSQMFKSYPKWPKIDPISPNIGGWVIGRRGRRQIAWKSEVPPSQQELGRAKCIWFS